MAKTATKRRAWTPEHLRTLKTIGSEENARWTYRQDTEANRGCHAAKGLQHGIIARLREPEDLSSNRLLVALKPRRVRGFSI